LVLEELDLFPKTVVNGCKALFINYGETEALYAMNAILHLRKQGLAVELYPDAAKIGKQLQYADKRNIPFAVIAGETEMQAQKFALKNLATGEQILLDLEGLEAGLY
jgi:histidyl-tRNA synthetase